MNEWSPTNLPPTRKDPKKPRSKLSPGTGVGVRMESTTIRQLSPEYPYNLILAIAILDGDRYAAIYDTIYRKGFINRIILHPHTSEVLVDTESIDDDTEFDIISGFFMEHEVFDMHRINRWIFSRLATDKKRHEALNKIYDRAEKHKLKRFK